MYGREIQINFIGIFQVCSSPSLSLPFSYSHRFPFHLQHSFGPIPQYCFSLFLRFMPSVFRSKGIGVGCWGLALRWLSLPWHSRICGRLASLIIRLSVAYYLIKMRTTITTALALSSMVAYSLNSAFRRLGDLSSQVFWLPYYYSLEKIYKRASLSLSGY